MTKFVLSPAARKNASLAKAEENDHLRGYQEKCRLYERGQRALRIVCLNFSL